MSAAAPPGRPQVADFIERHLDALARDWVAQVAELESARGLAPRELLASTPEMLRALVAFMREGPGGEAEATKRRLRDAHISRRLRLGYNQEEVVGEYVVLGRLVARLWEDLPPEAQPAAEDTARFFEALQRAMDAAVEQFSGYSVEDRQREKRALRQLDALAPPLLSRTDSPAQLHARLVPLLEVIREALAQDGARLYLADEAGARLLSSASAGACSDSRLPPGPVPLGQFLAQVVASDEPVHLADAALAPPEVTAGAECDGLRSLLGLRLWPHGKLLGALYVGSRHLRGYEPQARRYLETLVEYLSGILDRALIFQRLHEARRLHEEGEAHWRHLVQGMQRFATVYLLDPEGRVATWSEGAEHFEGYSADEVLGQHVTLFYPPGQGAEADRHLRAAAAQGRFSTEGWRVRRAQPSPFWAEMTLVANRDGAGVLQGFTKITRDLTERRHAEEERARLLERERHRSSQLQGLSAAAVAVHAAGSVEEVLREMTERARAIVGAHQSVASLSAEQGNAQVLSAVSLSDKYAAWRGFSAPPNGSGIYAWALERRRSARFTQAELVAHPRWRGFGAHAGAHPPLRGWLAAPLLRHDGRPFGIVQLSDREEGEFTEDDEAILVQLAQLGSVAVENAQLLAQLREGEERLRMSVAAARLGTWDFDPVSGALRWDERSRALFGLPADAPVTWDTFLAGLHPEDRARTAEQVGRALAGEGGGLFETEYRTVGLQDGRERWLSAHGRAFFDAAGRAVRFIGTVLDVTEHKRWDEEAARRLQFEQQLIGIVSHDLRSPLHAILLGTGALLRRPGLDPRLHQGLVRTLGSAERMDRLIRDLLDFTQARLGGGLPLSRRALDLHALARQTVEEVRLAHPERELHLECEGEGSGEGDPDRLAQVLVNLVTNALQYSPAHTPVQVRSRGLDGELSLSVHNAGPPIDPALLPRLFQPLERGAAAGTAAAQRRSIGLGLYIVQHIVQAHGGSIEVQSTAEAGTTFTVRLPRHGPRP